ncbi:hypothetical protein [Halalkaliarchaeum desulfuricum]|nr:hypothetical protein [Halalkaliarchaeum desulfuricum]
MSKLAIYILGLGIGALGAGVHFGAGMFLAMFVFVVLFVDTV